MPCPQVSHRISYFVSIMFPCRKLTIFRSELVHATTSDIVLHILQRCEDSPLDFGTTLVLNVMVLMDIVLFGVSGG